ncbi:MAG TPA: Maf family protein [Tepidisphaeraceae bacterium]|nr:Maf family protein [Tepidisphaeraceae bacterium]
MSETQPPILVLASRSPRRQELMREAGFNFVVDPADVDEEDYSPEVLPADLAIRLARIKSHTVATRRQDDFILGADTVVAFGDRVLGKPKDAQHARDMLRLLSGTTHIVITGLSLTKRSTGYAEEKRVMSAVRMRALSDKDIADYVESGLWEGKAGGYGIQDKDPFVIRMAGCYTNIVGLPMKTTRVMLAAVGIVPGAMGS